MPTTLTIPYLQYPDWLPGTVLLAEVDGDTLIDQIIPWGPERSAMGYGREHHGKAGYGFARSLEYGQGNYGAGHYAQGAQQIGYNTLSEFDNGPHSVRMRAYDAAGNPSDWGQYQLVWQLKTAQTPTALQISDGNLTWSHTP